MLSNIFYSTLLLLIFGTALIIKWYKPKTSRKLPPSPPRLPLIGNLHQLKGAVHEALFSIANRYADPRGLMLVYIGTIPSLIVSTREAAREILKTNDLAFADRLSTRMFKALSYDLKDVATGPCGDHWMQVKSILTQHFLSNKSVQSFEAMRRRVIAGYVRRIQDSFVRNEPIDFTSLALLMANDITCMGAFGRTYNVNDGEIGARFKKLMREVSEALGCFYFEDSIPQLAIVDIVRGVWARVDRVAATLDAFLTGAVEERLALTSHGPVVTEDGYEPFIDVLLRIYKEKNNNLEITMDLDVVKALLTDAYVTASDTTSSVIQWVMTELMINPDILKKAQEEVRRVLNGKQDVTSEDLEKMTYLKAVIMESMRLHPPIPILLPRVARYDVNVMGYDIAQGTRVYVNGYAIMRDPKVWENPQKFMPERFLESSGAAAVDFIRHNFEFLPFGAGRRGCPGRVYAMAIDEMALATFLYKFDWSLPQGVRSEDIDLGGTIGLANHKKIPLITIGKPVVATNGN